MNIRFATEDDLPKIYELYRDEQGDNIAKLNVILSPERIKASLEEMVRNRSVIIGEIVDHRRPDEDRDSLKVLIGGMAGSIIPCNFTNESIFMSMFFYIKEEYRPYTIAFLKKLTEMLSTLNISRLVIANPAGETGEKMDRFYRLSGFEVLETHFYKMINREPANV